MTVNELEYIKENLRSDLDYKRLHDLLIFWLREEEDSGREITKDFREALIQGIQKWPWLKELIVRQDSEEIIDILKTFGYNLFEGITFLLKRADPHFISIFTPDFSCGELPALLKKFISYMEEQRDFVIETGYPKYLFRDSNWFFRYWTKTLASKAPEGFHPAFMNPDDVPAFQYDKLFTEDVRRLNEEMERFNSGRVNIEGDERSKNGFRRIFYYWGRNWITMETEYSDFQEDVLCSYRDAPIISFPNKEYAALCDSNRQGFFDLKMVILHELSQAIANGNASSLWDNCVKRTNEAFPGDGKNFFFFGDDFYRYGGLLSLLASVWMLKTEIEKDEYKDIKTAVSAFKKDYIGHSELINEMEIHFDQAQSFWKKTKHNWQEFDANVEKFFEYAIPSSMKINSLLDLSYAKALGDHMNRCAALGTSSKSMKPLCNKYCRIKDSIKVEDIKTFESIPNLKWSEVKMAFEGDAHLRIEARNIEHKFSYADIGFLDHKKKGDQPDLLWYLLREFAMSKGEINWKNMKNPIDDKEISRMKTNLSKLRKRLKQIMQIGEDPFHNYKKEGCYRLKFEIAIPDPRIDKKLSKKQDEEDRIRNCSLKK